VRKTKAGTLAERDDIRGRLRFEKAEEGLLFGHKSRAQQAHIAALGSHLGGDLASCFDCRCELVLFEADRIALAKKPGHTRRSLGSDPAGRNARNPYISD
jgi:hypothetical protein